MTVIDLLRALVRRWWLVLPLVVATLAGTAVTFTSGETRFTSSVTLTLQHPEQDADAEERPAPSGQVLTAVLESDAIRADVVPTSADVDYVVTTGADPEGTLLQVTATGTPEVDTIAVVTDLLARIETEVQNREDAAGVRPADRTTVQILASPLRADAVMPPGTSEDPSDPTTYSAAGVALLTTPPASTSSPFRPSVATIRYLEELMSTPGVQGQLRPDARTGVTFQYDPRDSVPIFYLSAFGPSGDVASQTLDTAVDIVHQLLDGLQVDIDVPEEARTTASVLTPPTPPALEAAKIDRALVGVFGLGMVATVSLTVVFDGLLLARARRRDEAQVAEPADDLVAVSSSGPDEATVARTAAPADDVVHMPDEVVDWDTCWSATPPAPSSVQVDLFRLRSAETDGATTSSHQVSVRNPDIAQQAHDR